MSRRFTVALAATAAVGLAAGGVAAASAAPKKNEIRIEGGTVFKAGKYVKDAVHFAPASIKAKSGATVTLKNRGEDPAPHTITFVAKKFMPKSFDVAVEEQLLTAHQVDPTNEEAPPGVLVVDNGAAVPPGGTLNVDTGFTPTTAGDSAFIAPDQKSFSFKVTAKKGSNLFYFCAIHPWMQGKISVK
jgi:plastocyanin